MKNADDAQSFSAKREAPKKQKMRSNSFDFNISCDCSRNNHAAILLLSRGFIMFSPWTRERHGGHHQAVQCLQS